MSKRKTQKVRERELSAQRSVSRAPKRTSIKLVVRRPNTPEAQARHEAARNAFLAEVIRLILARRNTQ